MYHWSTGVIVLSFPCRGRIARSAGRDARLRVGRDRLKGDFRPVGQHLAQGWLDGSFAGSGFQREPELTPSARWWRRGMQGLRLQGNVRLRGRSAFRSAGPSTVRRRAMPSVSRLRPWKGSRCENRAAARSAWRRHSCTERFSLRMAAMPESSTDPVTGPENTQAYMPSCCSS